MLIAIPTRGRSQNLARSTLRWIPPSLYKNTRLFVREDELKQYQRALFNCQFNVEAIPTTAPNLALKRPEMAKWADRNGFGKFAMLDDDLAQFSVRIAPGETPLRKATPKDMEEMFATVEEYLGHYVHVGISARFHNNAYEGEDPVVVENSRMMRFLSYQVPVFLTCNHGNIITSEDFDITLQLLMRGYKNAVLYKWCQDQTGTQSTGGCEAYRTLELHNSDKELLAKTYPEVVRLMEKQNKGGGEFGHRTEAVINWQRAYEIGKERRGDHYP